ncbi:putative DNA-binding transcriptional regulator AlpA [Paraburkholderia sp. MM6662-R1]
MQQETDPASGSTGSSGLSDPKTAVAETDPRRVFTIDEFCGAYHLSRSFYYRLRHTGRGPREVHLGRKVVISVDDARAWEDRMHTLTHRAEPNG